MPTRKSTVGIKGKVVAATPKVKVTEKPSLKAAGRLTLLAKAWFLGPPHIHIYVQVLNEDGFPVTDLGAENFSAWIGVGELKIETVVQGPQELRGLYVVSLPLDHLPSGKGQYVYTVKAQKGAEQGWTLVNVLRL